MRYSSIYTCTAACTLSSINRPTCTCLHCDQVHFFAVDACWHQGLTVQGVQQRTRLAGRLRGLERPHKLRPARRHPRALCLQQLPAQQGGLGVLPHAAGEG